MTTTEHHIIDLKLLYLCLPNKADTKQLWAYSIGRALRIVKMPMQFGIGRLYYCLNSQETVTMDQ